MKTLTQLRGIIGPHIARVVQASRIPIPLVLLLPVPIGIIDVLITGQTDNVFGVVLIYSIPWLAIFGLAIPPGDQFWKSSRYLGETVISRVAKSNSPSLALLMILFVVPASLALLPIIAIPGYTSRSPLAVFTCWFVYITWAAYSSNCAKTAATDIGHNSNNKPNGR